MTSATPLRRRRRWPILLLAAGASLLLGLVVLEVVLRAVDPFPHPIECLRGFYRLDAAGRIETAPGWRGVQPVDGRRIEVRTDSLGLRGTETGSKARGERRVLMIGDSFVWGMGVPEEATIPTVLEQRLQARGLGPVRVGNAGMYGTSPREWGYTLARFRATYEPDAVVAVCYLGNDISDALLPPLYVLDGYVLTSNYAHAARASWRWQLGLRFRTWFYLERWLHRVWPIDVPPSPQLLPVGVLPTEGVFLDLDPAFDAEAPFVRAVEDLLAGHLRALADAARGLPLLVVLLPSHEVVLRPWAEVAAGVLDASTPPALAAVFASEHLQRGGAGRRLQRLCQALQIRCRDLDPEFAAAAEPQRLFLEHDWHFSPAGCAQVADWIAADVAALLAP